MVQIDAIITDLPQELFKDAKWHFERARKSVDSTDPFSLWREVRATVLFAFTAIEAFMNKVAFYYLERHEDIDPIIIDHLKEQQRVFVKGSIKIRKRFLSLETKIADWTRIITKKDFDKSDSVWQNFIKVKKFRDSLVHCHPDSEEIYNDANLKTAQLAIETVRNIIKRYYECEEKPAPHRVDL